MTSNAKYLLLVSCSQRKNSDSSLLPAIERYDGVNFRVLRKARREGYFAENLDILILSAKYGLLDSDYPIENYNCKMTRERALALQSEVSVGLDSHLNREDYREIFVNLAKTYLIAIEQSDGIRRAGQRVLYPTGGIGCKMSQMKKWLYELIESVNDSSPR